MSFKIIQTCIIIQMNLKNILLLLCAIVAISSTNSIKVVDSFSELAAHHCESFPIELLYRLSTGQLAEVYGKKYKDLDCYIRQFVNKDGQDIYEEQVSEEDGEQVVQEELPQNDPLVEQYAKGLAQCLPENTESVEAVYSIWRFVRFIVQNDYALEWMRAKIRATLGYEAEKPNAWMDGQQSTARLRLDKLFSNQFYEYVDQLMFKEFLHPFLTFLKRNVVFAASGQITQSGKPILVQYIETKNVRQKIFLPVVLRHKGTKIFSYTIPGIPLLLGGTTDKISWAFTGVLVDRSNIEQIQTLGNKFFHRDSETWIKLENVSLPIKIYGEEPAECKFVHSSFGTLYQKHESQSGKVSEYIARWHQKEKKVRVLFSELFQLITTNGASTKQLEFPFSSLVLTNQTGIHQYICYQKHPSYFLYPDLAGAPQPSKHKWISNPKRNFFIVQNSHLTTMNQQSYIKRQTHSPTEEQFLIDARRKISTSSSKFTQESLLDFVTSLDTDPLIKKRKDLLIHIYRKTKFLFFPEQSIRKQCDQLITALQKWDNHLSSNTGAPVFILWDYFFKDYTFNYVSSVPTGQDISKHKIATNVYWTNQMQLWKAGISYGQCDSYEWDTQYRKKLNGTGDNSTCFFNIMRGINRTREVLRNDNGGIPEAKLSDFTAHKVLDVTEKYLGTKIEEAFDQFFSKNVAFSVQLDSPKVIYFEGYQENKNVIDVSNLEGGSADSQVDTDL